MRYVPDLICLKIIKIKNFVIVNILEKPILNVILSCVYRNYIYYSYFKQFRIIKVQSI